MLIGPSDWDESRAPKAEFDRRIAALWAAFPTASQAIVFGSAAHHAELAYLTHFVPKLEPGIALLARDGKHKLLFGGGPNMIGAMKPLTFIADMAPLNALAKLIAGWTSPLLIGGGAMSSALRKTIDEATNSTAQDATGHVQSLMRQKSPSELAAIRDACDILNKAMTAMRDAARRPRRHSGTIGRRTRRHRFRRAGHPHAVQPRRRPHAAAVRDARRPPRPTHSRSMSAVRKFNYWAEGFACISNESQPAASLAALLLDNALSAIKPGICPSQPAKIRRRRDALSPSPGDARRAGQPHGLVARRAPPTRV